MYTALNSCVMDGVIYYTVQDFDNGGELEVLKERDLKMLIQLSFEMKTSDGEKVRIENNELVCNVTDVTEQMYEEDDWDFEDEGIDTSDITEVLYYVLNEFELSDDDKKDLVALQSNETMTDEDVVDTLGKVLQRGNLDGDLLDTIQECYNIYSDSMGYEFSDDSDDSNDEEFTEEEVEDIYGDYDDIYEEDEDDEAEGSVVSKLYELLNEEQIVVLKRYYLWFSQRLFENEQHKSGSLSGFKFKKNMIKKKNALNSLRADGQYRYAGFLDTGSIKKGYTCTLGHPLRYMHFAWDITKGDIETVFFGEDYNEDFERIIESNDCITFGIKCIGDFFEVDSDCIKALQRAQRDSLRDMSLLYDFYVNGNVQEVIDSFNLMDEVIKITNKFDIKRSTLSKDYKPMIPLQEALLYTQFRKVGLIPPKSLIQEIRSCFIGWTVGDGYFESKWAGELKYPNPANYNERLINILGKKYTNIINKMNLRHISYYTEKDLIANLQNYLYCLFTYQVCGVYQYNADTNKDEGGKSKPVRIRFQYHNENNFSNVFSDFKYGVDYAKDLLGMTELLLPYDEYSPISKYSLKVYNENRADYEEYPINQIRYSDKVYTALWGKFGDFTQFYENKLNSLKEVINKLRGLRYRYASSQKSNLPLNVDNMFDNVGVVISYVNQTVSELSDYHNTLVSFVDEFNEKLKAEHEEKDRLKEQERLEQEKAKAEQQKVDTPKKVIEFLNNADLSKFENDSNYSFCFTLLNQLNASGKEPSDKQFKHIQRLYEAVTKVEYTGVGRQDFITLETRDDIKEVFKYLDTHKDLADKAAQYTKANNASRILDIVESIKKYGTISKNQMIYVDALLKAYNG